MKKRALYIIAGLVLVGIVLLIVTDSGSGSNKKRKIDNRVTLTRSDKLPYGTFVAYEHLHDLFPDATVTTDRSEPGYWDSLSNADGNQALIIIVEHFGADDDEIKRLIRFAENGNDVFISASSVSYAVERLLHCTTNAPNEAPFNRYDRLGRLGYENDSLSVRLSADYFDSTRLYVFPGFNFSHVFNAVDETTTRVLGYNKSGDPNFIQLRSGSGNFYLHLAPIAFTNYFLLHKKNFSYYEQAFSVIKPETRTIVWDEYFKYKRMTSEAPVKKKGLLGVLMQYPALKWALFTAAITLLLYALLEMRRRQRLIPLIKRPQNDSLDFVKTVGRLYFDKGDHFNLCRKMGAYFLEYVRNKYKLSTASLDETFIKNLIFKSGAPEHEVRGIVSFILYLNNPVQVSPAQVTEFHQQLESFYKTA